MSPHSTKPCFKCGIIKAIDEFYVHAMMGDGHLGKCKECTKRDVKLRYDTHRDKLAAYERKRFKDPARKAKLLVYQAAMRKREPVKFKARQAVSNAMRTGRLTRLPCHFCGAAKTQAHHEDYSKPLDVLWVCFRCHREKCHQQKCN